jgi:hypothetical protein
MKLLLFTWLAVTTTFAQLPKRYSGPVSDVWPKFYKTTFESAEDVNGQPYDKPIFTEEVKALAGKVISLPGYIVPFQANSKASSHLMLSSLPLNACFFCGVGGPETAVEVFLKVPIRYTDQLVTIRGKLMLNSMSSSQLIFILENAEVSSGGR